MRLSVDGIMRAEGSAVGIAWMLVTIFFFVCVHTIGKYLVADYPVAQVVWGRYVFHFIIALALLGPRLLQALRTPHLRLQLARSTFMLCSTALYFAGVAELPLATANAISFTTPIWVTMLAPAVLGERVGVRRWAGVAAGFLGALIVIRPIGGEGVPLTAAALLLGSSLSNACYQITTKQLGSRDDPITTLLFTAMVGTVGASFAVPVVWTPMTQFGWLLMVAIGFCAAVGHFTLFKAFQAAPAAVVAPFNYSNLLYATLFGFLIFGDLPDRWTVLGAAIIVGSGLYIWYRERTVGRTRVPTP
jgi:drug/metabolite transporter (DMT)-like permease